MRETPKYYQVRTGLEEKLAGLEEGDPVPAERALAEEFAVARETVRQALHDLLVEGRIARRGRGTVVSAPKLVQPLSLQSYTEGAKKHGRTPSRDLVQFIEVDADDASVMTSNCPQARACCTSNVYCSRTERNSASRSPICPSIASATS